MIFVTVGSQKFQFNRLLKKIDELIEKKVIKEKVYAQIGVSDYNPQYFSYVDFMTQEEFSKNINNSDIIITHAGTGVIINALKKGKKVIAIPRLAKYGEHVDDHQIQLIKEFDEMNLLEPVYDLEKLELALQNVKIKKYNKYISNTDAIIEDIERFIEEN